MRATTICGEVGDITLFSISIVSSQTAERHLATIQGCREEATMGDGELTVKPSLSAKRAQHNRVQCTGASKAKAVVHGGQMLSQKQQRHWQREAGQPISGHCWQLSTSSFRESAIPGTVCLVECIAAVRVAMEQFLLFHTI
ncbi:hypothetical protein BLNAU_12319 [Blattamonas nauphoetae]|uniref:Uncharacterized protein n=1 Tax=Blattamonas nauphoetae TaxID=2049346 RepID=A0ABQ9XMF5_9EUKA|nr:hypothetical protein BLNAU_12319 [Blattamonas nauphoetae]